MSVRQFGLLAAVVAGASWFSLCSASASFITYNMDLTLGAASAIGSITTDGTIGTLNSGDIVNFDLRLTDGAFSALVNSGKINNGTNLTATATGLFFDFSSSAGAFFVFGGNPGLGFEDASGNLSGH